MYTVKLVNELPDVIIDIIFEYIPKTNVIFLNTTYYKLYHHFLKPHIRLYESYIRDVIKRDNDFVFKEILRENNDRLIKCKKYRYKDMIFNNYIYFLQYFCIEHNSEKCRQLLIEELSKRNLCKNLHKKKIVKYIKWRN
jgi:sugar-specific transcriptional regulator TrmB